MTTQHYLDAHYDLPDDGLPTPWTSPVRETSMASWVPPGGLHVLSTGEQVGWKTAMKVGGNAL